MRGPAFAGGLTLAATAYVALVDPHRPGHYLTCPLLAATGLYCAACGGLRAVHDLARLDVMGAWDMNPLLVVTLPLLLLGWARWLARSCRGARGWSTGSDVGSSLLAWAVLAVVVSFGVLRNVPALVPWLAP